MLKDESSNTEISVMDIIISIIGRNPKTPIHGQTRLQKSIFIALKEEIDDEILFSKCHFVPYRFGPYSFFVKEILGDLLSSGYVGYSGKKNTNSQKFFLTSKGLAFFDKLNNRAPKLIEAMQKVRKETDELTIHGLLRYVYNKPEYKKYLDKSAVRSRFEDITWGK
jgi:uncharacterized protein YwgA